MVQTLLEKEYFLHLPVHLHDGLLADGEDPMLHLYRERIFPDYNV